MRLEGQDLAALVKRLTADSCDVLHVGMFDLNATFRERRVRVADLAEVFGPGGTFVNVVHQWDTGEQVFGAGPFVGEPIAIDPASLRPYPFEPNAGALVADYVGPSAEVSPRRLLERLVAKAHDRGLGVRAAFEFEFLTLDDDAESLRESGFGTLETFAKDNRCWAGESAAIHAEFVAGLEQVLIEGDTDLLALGFELGPGCFEVTLSHGDPLRAADNAAFFKLFTKAFCRRQGKTASFMAQLGGDFPGLSGHIHLSLTDRETGKDLFPDPADDKGMSGVFRSFVAGLVALAPEAMPLTHHTANAYRRHAPQNWAPKSASWAVQNYAAAVRVVPQPASHCRLEYRLPGADINPFLALAFVLGAGLWGLESDAELPPELTGGGPGLTVPGGTALPHDLFEAAGRLARSERAAAIWGETFVHHLVEACRLEVAALSRETSAAERARYLEVV